MSEIMDIRLHHHLAQEFYRQQMLQRIPGNPSIAKLLRTTYFCCPGDVAIEKQTEN
jgi:hypothetical protein